MEIAAEITYAWDAASAAVPLEAVEAAPVKTARAPQEAVVPHLQGVLARLTHETNLSRP